MWNTVYLQLHVFLISRKITAFDLVNSGKSVLNYKTLFLTHCRYSATQKLNFNNQVLLTNNEEKQLLSKICQSKTLFLKIDYV
jgi:hypothetical protein